MIRNRLLSTIETRKQLPSLLMRVAFQKERFVIGRYGRPLAALVPIQDLHKLEAAEKGLPVDSKDWSPKMLADALEKELDLR